MIKKSIFFILPLFCMIIIGCGGGRAGSGVNLHAEATKQIIQDEPEWWSNPEEREGFVIGKAEGVSRSKEGSRKKAKNAIINDFAQKTKAIAEGRSEDFFKEVGEDAKSTIYDSFEDIQNSIWNGSVGDWVELKSTTVVERSQDENGRSYNIYRHYILGGIDQGAADKKLIAALKREKELMTAYEKTKAYDKLREDLERYKDKF